MKRIKLSKKLSLNKKTISDLDRSELNGVKGGFIDSDAAFQCFNPDATDLTLCTRNPDIMCFAC